MRIFLALVGILAFVIGLWLLGTAKSALHEIEAFVLLLIFVVCCSGTGIIEAIDRLPAKLTIELKKLSAP